MEEIASPSSMFGSNELSLFDAENVEELELLRRTLSAPSNTAEVPFAVTVDANYANSHLPIAERLFEQFKIEGNRKDWVLGTLDVDIIHRGRIRISVGDWPPVIKYCKHDLIEGNIVKQFRLHLLRHMSDVTLIYGTYRFREKIAKTWNKDYHCGKLIDSKVSIRETMINLAYWLTAQPHAEKNFEIWQGLIDESLARLSESLST